MADLWRFLPLSQRAADNESGVSSDHRQAVAAVIDELARISASRPEGAVSLASFGKDSGLDREWRESDGDLTQLRVRALARRRSIRALARCVAATMRVAADAGAQLQLDPMTAGAVALYASGAGPFERRAVVSGHTVRATDADWSFGSGPVLEGQALQIAGFLLGVTDEPPMPPRPGASDDLAPPVTPAPRS